MEWLSTAFYWYFATLILGLIFFPLVKNFFSFFIDKGYAFSRTVSILALTYGIYFFGSLKLLAFEQRNLILLLTISLVVFLVFLKKLRENVDSTNFKLILFEEGLFLLSFLFLTFIRGQEPSVRGLEKFMDFGFINSILRSRYFPPLDMWLSASPEAPKGFSINYYYFGHLTSAFLIKLTGVKPVVGYNLTLATIMGLGVTGAFSATVNIIYLFQKIVLKLKKIPVMLLTFYGLLGSYIVNLGGNLHTIYLFTKGYPNEQPIPFWQILSTFTPEKYWYPNATRFIPYTIHEFPSYSYVVADLHGHVFDIPFVLLTLALFFALVIRFRQSKLSIPMLIANSSLVGFMVAVHYMTNAFDGPIYFLLALIIFLIALKPSKNFLIALVTMVASFIIFSLPFTHSFNAFVSGIGVNCSAQFLTNIGKLGPFLFEAGNCQISPVWMLFVLWGFFFISLVLFYILKKVEFWRKIRSFYNDFDGFTLVLLAFGIFLIIIPEFFYVKDIYPAHFRANTMFKLGYQAFMMMGIASTFVFYRMSLLKGNLKYVLKLVWMVLFFFVFLYPFFSFKSYYGELNKKPNLEGDKWMQTEFPANYEIVNYINQNIKGQPVILEAQGDSYTDYEMISAYTGVPTVAGWWVHEWLWRGSADVVGRRIPDIESIYQSKDLDLTRNLLKKYHVEYVVVSTMEKDKYKALYEDKFNELGRRIFETSDENGALYQLK